MRTFAELAESSYRPLPHPVRATVPYTRMSTEKAVSAAARLERAIEIPGPSARPNSLDPGFRSIGSSDSTSRSCPVAPIVTGGTASATLLGDAADDDLIALEALHVDAREVQLAKSSPPSIRSSCDLPDEVAL